MRTLSPLPIPVKKALKELGQDIRKARLRRRITMELVAERACISRTTLTKVEKGDPAVALGIYAAVIFALGLISRLTHLLEKDELGESLEEERLPKRIRHPKPKNP